MAQRKMGQGLIRRDPSYGTTFSLGDEPKVEEPPKRESGPKAPEDEGDGTTVAVPEPLPAEAGPDVVAEPKPAARPPRPPKAPDASAPSAAASPVEPPRPQDTSSLTVQGKATVTVRVRPKAAQAARIAATAYPPKRVMKAAWRRAVEGYVLRPEYVEAIEAERAGGRDGFYSTTITVDAATLAALVREHDPLGTQGAWWVLRGQLEPLFWVALDGLLDELDRKSRQ